MICPHCATAALFNWNFTDILKVFDNDTGLALGYGLCPNCYNLVVTLESGSIFYDNNSRQPFFLNDGEQYFHNTERILYPQLKKKLNLESVPQNFVSDYNESLNVVKISPKSSAALNRRILQNILREHFGIKKRNLSEEIEEFINKKEIPSHITDAVDAVRQIGNIAAHPIKNNSTGEIVDVEPGEAEWLVEVIEALFDFCFIQPQKIIRRKEELNRKLKELGKPKLK